MHIHIHMHMLMLMIMHMHMHRRSRSTSSPWAHAHTHTHAHAHAHDHAHAHAQALSLDVFALGRVLRYMLTGVPPSKSVLAALEEQSMLRPLWWAVASRLCPSCAGKRPRELREPSELSARARACMDTLLTSRLSAVEASGHVWLTEAPAEACALGPGSVVIQTESRIGA